MRAYYHVTDPDEAREILREGFLPGWGDVGFGVYLWGSLTSARRYAKKGGWDKKLGDPVILMVGSPEIRPIHDHEVHPDWPNPEDYVDMFFWEGDEDNEEELLVPEYMEVVE